MLFYTDIYRFIPDKIKKTVAVIERAKNGANIQYFDFYRCRSLRRIRGYGYPEERYSKEWG